MFKRFLATLLLAIGLLGTPGVAHAARYWLTNELTDIADADRASVATPQPVQLIFQFKTNGAPNARATNFLKDRIREMVTSSGVFSEVSTEPVANGAILSITIDNVGDTQEAERQGFATGLTFGLHGSTVADHYAAIAEYVRGTGADVITKEVHHTLITTIGITQAPPDTTQVRNANDAIMTIVRQIVAHLINDTARDPAFGGQAQPEAARATPAAADAPAVPSTADAAVVATPAAETAPAATPETAH